MIPSITRNVKPLIKALIIVGYLALNGCSGVNLKQWHFPYMMPVRQGNYITEAQYKQIKVGMTREEVIFILGQPLNNFMFSENRLDYLYQEHQNNQLKIQYAVTIILNKDNIVTNIYKQGSLPE